ncbi:MAG: oligosaccharide flippase family protein [Suipraeoptans sp.]
MINKFRNILTNKISNSMKNVVKISSGTMAGQAISLVSLPIYTRIYGAGIIGNWTLVISIAAIINTFSDLGLSNTIMIEEDEDDTKALYAVITTIVFILSALSSLIYGLYSILISSDVGKNIGIYTVLVFLQIFTQQQIQLSYSWLNRKKKYNVLMKNPLINNLCAAIVAIPLGLIGFKAYGYYIGLLIGQMVTIIHMRRNLPLVFFNFRVSDYKRLIRKHKNFPLYQMPINILAQLKNQLPAILIRGFFSAEVLGYYSIAIKVLKLPITFLGEAVGKVYYRTISEMQHEQKKIGEYTLRNMTRAMKIAIVPMVALLSVGDIACLIIFGSEYIVTGNIVRIIAFNCFFNFLSTSTQGISIVLRKQKYLIVSATFQIIGYLVGLSLGSYIFNSVYIGCFITSVIYCIAQMVYFSAIFHSVDIAVSKYIKGVASSTGIILVSAAVIRWILNLAGLV